MPKRSEDPAFVNNRAFHRSNTEERFDILAYNLDGVARAEFIINPVVVEGEVDFSKGDLLSAEEEKGLFLLYNYYRYRLAKLIEESGRRKRSQIHYWSSRVRDCRSRLANSNMALVISMAKRHNMPDVELEERISEGNMALLRSIDHFDVARGYKFSTYACGSIIKALDRLRIKEYRRRERFSSEYIPGMEKVDNDGLKHDGERAFLVSVLREGLFRRVLGLNEMEEQIVILRFGFDGHEARILKEVSKLVGVTQERVRQVQNRALQKCKELVDKTLRANG